MADRAHLAALRLSAQGIATRPFDEPAEVVRHLLAMQAQDYPGVRWAVGLRTTRAVDSTVERAIADGQIVRSWPMRGTLHLTAPEDLGWILALTAPRQANWGAKRRGDLEITDAQLSTAGTVAEKLMTGGKAIRRDRLLEAWERAGVSTAGQRGYHLLWNLGQLGLIVFGPGDGKQPTFALLEERIRSPRILAGDEALAEFAGRYFRSHGPATVQDFAWWSSLTLKDARRGLAAAAGLERREVDGTTYYLAEGLEPAKNAVHALPGFDEYLLGYRDRSLVLDDGHFERIVPGRNGIFFPTIVSNGRVVGTWKRTESAKKVTVSVEGFARLNAAATARALKGYGTFLGKAVELLP